MITAEEARELVEQSDSVNAAIAAKFAEHLGTMIEKTACNAESRRALVDPFSSDNWNPDSSELTQRPPAAIIERIRTILEDHGFTWENRSDPDNENAFSGRVGPCVTISW